MKTLPQISEAEFEVMKIVWEHAPISTGFMTAISPTCFPLILTTTNYLKPKLTRSALFYPETPRRKEIKRHGG